LIEPYKKNDEIGSTVAPNKHLMQLIYSGKF